MKLAFSKMHGLGNDFVVLDGVRQSVNLTPAQIRFLADRHLGVGCDQLLLVERASDPAVDFRYRIFNADGGEVEQCGNGARCFARFVREQGLTDKTAIRVETNTGQIVLYVQADGQVTVDMGQPRFEPLDIPFHAPARATHYTVTVAGQDYTLGAVSMGNPHAVLVVDNVDTAPVATLGAQLERHPQFPARVNVGFMQVLNPEHIRLRVFERGVGETRACGTGACAAVAVGRVQGLLASAVQVDLPGGSLHITWSNATDAVAMTGPATHVFAGEIAL